MPNGYHEPWKEPFLASPSFEKAKSTARLKDLATQAPDLSRSGFLTQERIASLFSQGANLLLLYGFERVNQEILKELQALADERRVVAQMQALYSGHQVNFIEGYESDKRAALHPATRDVFQLGLVKDTSAKLLVEAELQKLRSFFETLPAYFETILFIGIGGSELGPHALAEALLPYHLPNKKARYVANVDPDDMTHAFHGLDCKKTLVAVISKSGTTLETSTNEARARAYFEKAGLNPQEYFIAVTMPKTPMDDTKKYRAIFHMFDFVGGRYSATSVVGGILISFLAGVNSFFELLDGANQMDRLSLSADMRENLPLLLALLGVWNRNFLHFSTNAVIPYSQLLHRFPAHLQQCDMESNGKSITRLGEKVGFSTGPIIWGEPGTNAQHSFFQLLHQGTETIPVEFIGFKEPAYKEDFVYEGTSSQEKLLSNLFAQAIALATGKMQDNPNKSFFGNRPSTIILGSRVDPRTLGSLLSLYEHKVAFQGFLWGINSFDQEGVQLGKVMANELLHIKKARREGKEEMLFSPLGRRLFDIVDDFSAAQGFVPRTTSNGKK